MFKDKSATEKRRRAAEETNKKALRASMMAIQQESKRLAKGQIGSSDPAKKANEATFIDRQLQGLIHSNLKGLLGDLGNITEAVVERGEDLKEAKAAGGGLADLDHPEARRVRQHSVMPPSNPKH